MSGERRGVWLPLPKLNPIAVHSVLAVFSLLAVWAVFWWFYPRTQAWFAGWFVPLSGWANINDASAILAMLISVAAPIGAFVWIFCAVEKHRF